MAKGYTMLVEIQEDRMGNLLGSPVSEKHQKDLEAEYGTYEGFAQEGMPLHYEIMEYLSDGAKSEISRGWPARVRFPIDAYWHWVEFHRTEDSYFKNPAWDAAQEYADKWEKYTLHPFDDPPGDIRKRGRFKSWVEDWGKDAFHLMVKGDGDDAIGRHFGNAIVKGDNPTRIREWGKFLVKVGEHLPDAKGNPYRANT